MRITNYRPIIFLFMGIQLHVNITYAQNSLDSQSDIPKSIKIGGKLTEWGNSLRFETLGLSVKEKSEFSYNIKLNGLADNNTRNSNGTGGSPPAPLGLPANVRSGSDAAYLYELRTSVDLWENYKLSYKQ